MEAVHSCVQSDESDEDVKKLNTKSSDENDSETLIKPKTSTENKETSSCIEQCRDIHNLCHSVCKSDFVEETVVVSNTSAFALSHDDEDDGWEFVSHSDFDSLQCTCHLQEPCSLQSFRALPNEIKVHIFGYLSPYERARCAEVCREWHQVTRIPLLWRDLDLLNVPLCLGNCYKQNFIVHNNTEENGDVLKTLCQDTVENYSVDLDSLENSSVENYNDEINKLHELGERSVSAGRSKVHESGPNISYLAAKLDECYVGSEVCEGIVRQPMVYETCDQLPGVCDRGDILNSVRKTKSNNEDFYHNHISMNIQQNTCDTETFSTCNLVEGNTNDMAEVNEELNDINFVNKSKEFEHCACYAESAHQSGNKSTTRLSQDEAAACIESNNKIFNSLDTVWEKSNPDESMNVCEINQPSELSVHNRVIVRTFVENRRERDALLCYRLYCRRMHGLLSYLCSVIKPAIQVLRVALNIEDQWNDVELTNESWYFSIKSLLSSCHLKGLHTVSLFWDRTPAKPLIFSASPDTLQSPITRKLLVDALLTEQDLIDVNNDIVNRRRSAQRRFTDLFEVLVRSAPNLLRLCVPFDWSPRSLKLICSLRHLNTLVLHRSAVTDHNPPSSVSQGMQTMLGALPVLERLSIDLSVRSGKGVTCIGMESSSLRWLDLSRCRGIYVDRLKLPQATVVKLSRYPVLNTDLVSTRADVVDEAEGDGVGNELLPHYMDPLIDRYGYYDNGRVNNRANSFVCLYDVLVNGCRRLQQLNEHILHSDWEICLYAELDLVLSSMCLCYRHSLQARKNWVV